MRRLVSGVAVILAVFAVVEAGGIPKPNGLDPSFGTGGKVVTDLAGSLDEAYAVAIQPNGKIVVAGTGFNPSNGFDFALVRYDREGHLDPSFGAAGKVLTTFSEAFPSFEAAQATVLQPDGKVIAAGWSDANLHEDGGFDFALARYHPDGSLDSTFGTNGKVLTDFGAFVDFGFAIALQRDGKLLAAGVSDGDFAIARYNSDGSLDPSFGAGGTVLTDLDGSYDEARAIAVFPNGAILVAGTRTYGFALVRYHRDGSLDMGFGNGGKVLTRFGGGGGAEVAYGIVLQPHGKIVAAGTAGLDFALARYHADGSLDESFGSSGRVLTDFNANSADVAYALAAQPNGTLVAAGFGTPPTGGLSDFAIARYTKDGTLDPTFGAGGLALIDFGSPTGGEGAFAVGLQPDGSIVVAGRSSASDSTDFSVARYTSHTRPN